MTKVGLYAIGTSTTLESNKSLAGNALTQAPQAANAPLQSLLGAHGPCAVPDVLHDARHVKDALRPLGFERGIASKHDQRMDALG